MQRIRVATTHVDRQNERISKEALESGVEQTNKDIIPLNHEHDPRIPPLGRIIRAELVQLDDGEFALEGIAEIFEEDFPNLEDLGEREIKIRKYPEGKLTLTIDKTYKDEESQAQIEELRQILNQANVTENGKKSFEPISILIIGGCFILGKIAEGFFQEMGADAYKSLKSKLSNIFLQRKKKAAENLFQFDVTVKYNETDINVQVIMTNPTEVDINEFLDSGIRELDQLLVKYLKKDNGFKRLVFDFKAGELILKFAVMKNGVPVLADKNK